MSFKKFKINAEINLHVQDLRNRIDNDYREDLVKLQQIIDYGDWSGVKGEDLHLQKTREELIAYRNDLSLEIDQANDLYTQNIPSFEETDLNYSYDGDEYSADPDYPAQDFDRSTYDGQFRDWMFNTDSGRESTKTFEKIIGKVDDAVIDAFVQELLRRNPTGFQDAMNKLLIQAASDGINVSKDELLKIYDALQNENLPTPDLLDQIRAFDLIDDSVKIQRSGDVLSYQEWSEKNLFYWHQMMIRCYQKQLLIIKLIMINMYKIS